MSRPWMPMYWGDYLRDTLDLDTRQHGAYLLLIAHYWENGGLPTDDVSLCKIVHANRRQWRQLKPAVAAKFGPGWKHKRIEAEIERAEKRLMQRALAGQKGGTATSIAASKRSSNRLKLNQADAQATVQATGHQPHKKIITTTTSVAAREEPNPAVGPATALSGSAPSRPPGTTDGEAKQPPRKEGKPARKSDLPAGTIVGPEVLR